MSPNILDGREQIQRLLEIVVASIVAHPFKTTIGGVDNDEAVDFVIDVDPSDLAGLIGRKGHTVEAIRMLAACCGRRGNKSVSIEFRTRQN